MQLENGVNNIVYPLNQRIIKIYEARAEEGNTYMDKKMAEDGLKILLGVILGFLILAFILTWLWNLIIPVIFVGVAPLTYWQAIGLITICRILFARIES